MKKQAQNCRRLTIIDGFSKTNRNGRNFSKPSLFARVLRFKPTDKQRRLLLHSLKPSSAEVSGRTEAEIFARAAKCSGWNKTIAAFRFSGTTIPPRQIQLSLPAKNESGRQCKAIP